ncbi:MAG TPA: hypothetical protein VMZ25_03780 [Terriglobales bacterium]|nr:hypothetical protein [Terriglobales bacterium]
MDTLRKLGVWLVVLAFALLLLNAISSLVFVRANPAHGHDQMEYVTSWPLSLTVAIALLGIRVCLTPLLRGESWAWTATLLTWLVIAVPRLLNDPRCLQLDLNRHGCHTFMITLAVAVAGLVLSRPRAQALS